MHGGAEHGIGGVAVVLHGVEQGEVVAVYGDCRHGIGVWRTKRA